jgi:ferredoxin-NADP reductase
VLPKEPNKKTVFIAGGIGVTPFRSMVKYLTDKNEARDVVLMYFNKKEGEIAYRNILDAAKPLGVKTNYVLTDVSSIRADWPGERGQIDEKMVREKVPDFAERTFYLSGPRGMVVACENMLKKMGVKRSKIVTDYFPGFA